MNKSWLTTLTNKVPAAWLKNSAANCRSHHLEEVLWPPDQFLGASGTTGVVLTFSWNLALHHLATAVHEPLQNDTWNTHGDMFAMSWLVLCCQTKEYQPNPANTALRKCKLPNNIQMCKENVCLKGWLYQLFNWICVSDLTRKITNK